MVGPARRRRICARRRRFGAGAKPALVQRSRRQQLFPGTRSHRPDHDPDRRPADRTGDGARVGARHVRGALRHAGPRRGNIAGQDDPLFRARDGGARPLRARRQVPVPRSDPRLDLDFGRRVDALSAGGAGDRAADLVACQEPVRLQHGDIAGHVSSRAVSLRLPVRPAQYAGRDPRHQLRASRPLLRRTPSDRVPRGRRLGGHRAECRGFGPHGGGAPRNDAGGGKEETA